jgi:hypothetical protein
MQYTVRFVPLPVMIKKITSIFLACMFLTGSTLLPLGDFSLMRDIPGMYRNYAKITTAAELGVIDFIGDYLLHGKEMFGHNKNDKSQNGPNGVQFQHQANPSNIVLLTANCCSITIFEVRETCPVCKKPIATPGYHRELFRPPLA